MNTQIQTIEGALLRYALDKQIPLDCESLSINTNYGNLELDGDLGRKAVKAVRLVINQHLSHKKKGGDL